MNESDGRDGRGATGARGEHVEATGRGPGTNTASDPAPSPAPETAAAPAPTAVPPEHPVRTALLGLLARTAQATASEAARTLGVSSGLCSFHLRRLASAGLIEEVRQEGGRARPWRLVGAGGEAYDEQGPAFDAFQRGLEDESYRRWTAERDTAPAQWREDDAFSAVLHLTPAELAALGDRIRALVAPYRTRDWLPGTRPAGSAPVAVVSRIFPVLPAGE